MTKPRAATKPLAELPSSPFPDGARPTWEIALLFPPQGTWTEEDYWALEGSFDGFRRVELSNGHLDVLPWPTEVHQLILVFLLDLLADFTRAQAPGVVLLAGLKVRLRKGIIREPDVVYMKEENRHRRHNKAWDGADLVMEVVSGDPKDWETKPKEYARAGIPEYWIVDPEKKVIRVLTLEGKTYRVHGDFGPGTQATSVLLPGFAVSVDSALAPPGSEQPE